MNHLPIIPGRAIQYIGDARECMAAMEPDSVDCVITSPPYWGLRSYGTDPQVWGGNPRCAHEWGDEITITKGGPHGKGVMVKGSRSVIEAQAAVKKQRAGCFCIHCGAWRGELGLEPNLGLFIEHTVEVFEAVRRILKPSGTLWLNIGDTYASGVNGQSPAASKAAGDDRTFRDKPFATTGPVYDPDARTARGKFTSGGRQTHHDNGGRILAGGYLKPKDRVMIPARVAIALQEAGWWLRDEIVWFKTNPMPSSIKDRTTPAHEMVYMLSKRQRYYFDPVAIAEPSAPVSIARYMQPKVHDQKGGSKADAYESGYVGQASRDRRPNVIISHLAGQMNNYDEHLVAGERWKARHAGWHAIAAEQITRNKRGVWPVEETVIIEIPRPGPASDDKPSVWKMPTEPMKEAHFATMPTALVEPMVLAGTSAKGNCARCGKPWARIVVSTRMRDGKPLTESHHGRDTDGTEQKIGASGVGHWRDSTDTRTLGWYPTCKCDKLPKLPDYPEAPEPPEKPEPSASERVTKQRAKRYQRLKDAYDRDILAWQEACADITGRIRAIVNSEHVRLIETARPIVLDPFGGSGTVALVAARHGRMGILIDLKPEYTEIASRRIRSDWSGEEGRRMIANEARQQPADTLPLFGGTEEVNHAEPASTSEAGAEEADREGDDARS